MKTSETIDFAPKTDGRGRKLSPLMASLIDTYNGLPKGHDKFIVDVPKNANVPKNLTTFVKKTGAQVANFGPTTDGRFGVVLTGPKK